MSAREATFALEEAEPRGRYGESLFRRSVRRLLRKKIAFVCLIFIAFFYVVALSAAWIAPYGYAEQNLDISFQGPSWEHPFGTDRNGRDIMSRCIFAMQTTVAITLQPR